MSEKPVRRNFAFLVATLNAVFPDYDFQEVEVTTFQRISLGVAESRINTGLASALSSYPPDVRTKLWSLLDQQIRLRDCEIYEFTPDPDADPFAEDGSRWSVKLFLLNSKLSRVLFFSTACFYRSGGHAGPSSLGEFRPTSLMDEDSEADEDFMSDEG
jgi:repressor of RNA polymerase III transcription MAF1